MYAYSQPPSAKVLDAGRHAACVCVCVRARARRLTLFWPGIGGVLSARTPAPPGGRLGCVWWCVQPACPGPAWVPEALCSASTKYTFSCRFRSARGYEAPIMLTCAVVSGSIPGNVAGSAVDQGYDPLPHRQAPPGDAPRGVGGLAPGVRPPEAGRGPKVGLSPGTAITRGRDGVNVRSASGRQHFSIPFETAP